MHQIKACSPAVTAEASPPAITGGYKNKVSPWHIPGCTRKQAPKKGRRERPAASAPWTVGPSSRLPETPWDSGSSPRDVPEPCGSWGRGQCVAWLCLFLALAPVGRNASVCFHCYRLTQGNLNPEHHEALGLLKVLWYSPEFLNQWGHGILPLAMWFLSGGGFPKSLATAGTS